MSSSSNELEIWIRGCAPWDDGELHDIATVEIAVEVLDDEDRLDEWLEDFAEEWAIENVQPVWFFEARFPIPNQLTTGTTYAMLQ